MFYTRLVAVLSLAGASAAPVVVFAAREGNFTSIINPSAVRLSTGRLLVFAEARLHNGGDGSIRELLHGLSSTLDDDGLIRCKHLAGLAIAPSRLLNDCLDGAGEMRWSRVKEDVRVEGASSLTCTPLLGGHPK